MDIDGGYTAATASMRDDPFAAREGKTLTWQNINMTLNKKGEEERKLLSNVWGEVPKKEITAVMGPSGAGKTSLLNILAGRASTNGPLTIQADIRLDNYAVDPKKLEVRKQIAFVAQDDSLQVTSTPREAIRFSAKLRLPKATTEGELDHITERMLEELGLTKCADTLVGGALLKGISGGERKRTSVGVELVTKPALVFLDEPTSGLDSFSAVQLVQVLKKVANAGSSVLFTIHQPASEIFNAFDNVILMNRGKVMYQGAVDSVPDYFGTRGHPLPPNYNPADWIMNVAQTVETKELETDGFFPTDERDIGMPFTADDGDGKDALGITVHSKDANVDDTPVGIGTEISLLFVREIKNTTRDVAALGARFGFTLVLSTLIGIIFLNVGETDNANPVNLQSHFGAMIMVTLMSMFGTAQPALLSFPEERPVFLREYSTNHYSVFSYFISRLTMEAVITFLQVLLLATMAYLMIGFQMEFYFFLVIVYTLAMASTALAVALGCSVDNPKLAEEMLPILFVPQMLFAGFFIGIELIPSFLRWARFLCSLTFALRLELYYEFNDCANGSQGEDAAMGCQRLLDNVQVVEDEVWWYWIVLVVLFLGFRLMALFILKQRASKFF